MSFSGYLTPMRGRLTQWSLRDARRELGLTQAETALRLNIDVRTLRRWEAKSPQQPMLRLAMLGMKLVVYREHMAKIAVFVQHGAALRESRSNQRAYLSTKRAKRLAAADPKMKE